MTNPVPGSANGTHSSSVSDGKAPPSSQEAAQRMADAVAAEKTQGFALAFDGPDLTIIGTDANDTISVKKQQDGTLRVQAKGSSGYYDILPDVGEVTIDARGGDNEISVGSDIERPFTLIAGGGVNELHGSAGGDVLIGNGRVNRLFGGDGGDYLGGNGASNVLHGGDGDDIIRGGEGKDCIDGGAGRDIIDGGSGLNEIRGQAGDDLVYSAASSDAILGGSGDDTVVRRYPRNTGREAQVFDIPDRGSVAYRHGDEGANPGYLYEERKK